MDQPIKVILRTIVTATPLLLLISNPLAGQSERVNGIDVNLSLGRFADYPSAFSGRYCEQGGGGISGMVGYPLTAAVAVEFSALLSAGVGGEQCTMPTLVAHRDGDTFSRMAYDDGIEGQSFFATNLGVRVEPWAEHVVSPRFRVGGGRLWDKGLGNWFYGGDFRIRLGSNAITFGVERWALRFDLRREELIYRDSGAHELQSVQIIPQSPNPFLFKIGWERRVG